MSTPIERISDILAEDLERVNVRIVERMQSQNAPRIPEISAYLIQAGGKRIRPVLTLAAAEICGYKGDAHISLATAVEFIHTATLLHDDVVDGSEKRRGKKTANLMWDNKSSVLVGDYLFSRSFQLMVEAGDLEVLGVLANASAVISEGEVLQLVASSDIDTSEETYFKVITGKTAALFEAASQVGAMVAEADLAVVQAFAQYGLKLGLAFQIADDVLDFIADDKFGKAVGNDFAEGKLTLPIIRAISAADGDEKAFWYRTIARGQQGDDDLREAIGLLKKHGTIESSRETAFELANDAKAALKDVPKSELTDQLIELADYVVERLT